MALYKNYSKRERKKRYLRNGIITVVLLILALTTLFPIYYMIISSFGEPIEAGAASYSLLLRNPTLNSYKFFFDYSKYSYRWIVNSFIVAGAVTITNVLFATTAGYAFAKLRFAGNKVMFFIILVAMMIPYQVTQVPLYILVVNV
ncbi:MAG: carbohydrate ABC transporter permease, partial [Lachnospiraceae bacterium]|nr:carbohydrate ABC transporter permease [Lachnospiraceae bacterium]